MNYPKNAVDQRVSELQEFSFHGFCSDKFVYPKTKLDIKIGDWVAVTTAGYTQAYLVVGFWANSVQGMYSVFAVPLAWERYPINNIVKNIPISQLTKLDSPEDIPEYKKLNLNQRMITFNQEQLILEDGTVLEHWYKTEKFRYLRIAPYKAVIDFDTWYSEDWDKCVSEARVPAYKDNGHIIWDY